MKDLVPNNIEGEERIFYYPYKDNKLRLIRNYKNGELHGEFKRFWINGNMDEEGNYINGKKDGEWIIYYNTGEVKDVGYYVNGSKKRKK